MAVADEAIITASEGTNPYGSSNFDARSLTRTLGLPQGVKASDISASTTDGVLEIHVSKPEEVKPRRIQIGVGASKPETIEGTATKTE